MVTLYLFYLLFPIAIIWLCSRFEVLNKIGAIIILYFIGIIIGNSGLLPESAASVQDVLSSAVVPIAIPLMLFNCDFKVWSIRKALMALITGIISVAAIIVITLIIFKPLYAEDQIIAENSAKLAGLLSGVYTGGTPNLAALKLMLDVPNELYLMVHTYEMVASFLYLAMLLTFGIRLFRKILPTERSTDSQTTEGQELSEQNYSEIFNRQNWKSSLKAIGIAIAIAAISAGTSLLLTGDISMTIVILMLSTLGIAASQIKGVRKIKGSFDIGMYLILIFSLVVSSMADLSKMNLHSGVIIIGMLCCVVFGSLILQTILARIFKIDADTMIISSVSLINSPPFVPMMCTAMRNRSVMLTGLSVGILGYAAGNYLGFIIYYIMQIL